MAPIEEVPELVSPEEGFSTLSAQITRQSVDRITTIIRRERQKGTPNEKITRALRNDLSDYDDHTRGLLERLADEGTIADDFKADNVASRVETKPGRVVLTVKENPADLRLYSLVRYLGSEWLVVECREKDWTLKKL